VAFSDHTHFFRIRTAVLVTALLVAWLGTAIPSEVATILASEVNVRSGPGMQQRVLFRLSKQTRVRVLERRGEWLKIDHNGRQGYILGKPGLVSLESSKSRTVENRKSQLKDLYREAETLQEKLEASQSQLDEMTRKERDVLDEINAVEQALDGARRKVREARAGLDSLERRVAAIEQQHNLLEKEIAAGEDYTARRLVALYKLNWVGRIQLLAAAHSFYDFISRKSALERILALDEARLAKLRGDQLALTSLLEQLNAGKAEKRSAQISLDRHIGQLRAEMARRATLLNTIRGQKELEGTALQALRQAVKELDGTIAKFESEPPPARPAQAAASKRDELFETSKGLLGWPVKGKIVSLFGPYRDEKANVTGFQSGINIQAERGEPVRAVSDGHTIYASWFKGFGNLMIIDHGNHYYTVYAHLEEVFKLKGDRVEKGEVIATVGDSGSLIGPALHFEVRHHGKPVDPLQWINKG